MWAQLQRAHHTSSEVLCKWDCVLGVGSALYMSPSRNPVVSFVSWTLDNSPIVHFTCNQICAPPGPSTFLPSSSSFNTQSLNAWLHFIFNIFGAAVSNHCFLNAVTRWSYVSFLAAYRSVNHSSSLLLNLILFFRQLIFKFLCCMSVFINFILDFTEELAWQEVVICTAFPLEGSFLAWHAAMSCGLQHRWWLWIGDVAGVSLQDGHSENERDNWLKEGDEDGKELSIPVGEPLGVNMAGWSVFVVVWCVKWLYELHNWGNMHWKVRAASYGYIGGGGLMWTAGSGGMLGVGYQALGTGYWVL